MFHTLICRAGIGAATIGLLGALPAPVAAQRGGLPPTNVTVTAAATGVTVAWSGVRGKGVTYRVLRALDARAPGVDLTAPIGTTSFADSRVVAGTAYFYQVVAVYADGTTGTALPVAFTLPARAPGPANFPSGARSLGLSGKILPLAQSSGGLARSAILTALDSYLKCDPAQPLPGPSPSSFFLDWNEPGGPTIGWPEVAGAVAYVVDRAVDGTDNWKMAGTTCGSPNAIRRMAAGPTSYVIEFHDFSGGIVPNTPYVYRVKAFSASGEMGWNSTRWTAPPAPAPTWLPTVITGSTAKLRFEFLNLDDWNKGAPPAPPVTPIRMPDQWILTASDGRSWTGLFVLPGVESSVSVLGLPVGTYTFTLTAQWIQNWDPRMPRVTATSSTQATVTIKI